MQVKESTMKRFVQRLAVIVGGSSALLAAATATANAGLPINHSDPVARDTRRP
jgi:hypothetical protein